MKEDVAGKNADFNKAVLIESAVLLPIAAVGPRAAGLAAKEVFTSLIAAASRAGAGIPGAMIVGAQQAERNWVKPGQPQWLQWTLRTVGALRGLADYLRQSGSQ